MKENVPKRKKFKPCHFETEIKCHKDQVSATATVPWFL